jgi:radical SAM protein with 4Fe4S-binding SPASM domain
MPDDEDLTSAMLAVKTWLGNPLSRFFIRFLTQDDSCGNRLANSIDFYCGSEKNLCWKCKLGGSLIGYILKRSGALFGISDSMMKEGLENPVFKRGLINVLRGIGAHGITTPQRIHAPFLVVWDFTHLCNLRCKHCYQDAQAALEDELTTEEAKGLIDQLAEAGVVVIAFSGGEPLMRKDFFEIAEYAKSKDFYIALASNGTLITPHVASRLKEAGVYYVEISIDGKDAISHDTMRGIRGAFDRSIRGIESCVKEGLYTCIATTVTQDNYSEIPEIYALAKKMGVQRLMGFNFIPTGRGIQLVDQDISPEEREELLKYMLTIDVRGEKPECLSTAPQLARVAVEIAESEGVPVGHFYLGQALQGKTRMLADFIGGCGAGRLYCSIEPNGEVQPCVFMPISVGNIRDTDFISIWHNSPVLETLRNRENLNGGCGSCDRKFICGGCRARAWAYFQDISAPDPGCIHNRVLWEHLKASRTSPVPQRASLAE